MTGPVTEHVFRVPRDEQVSALRSFPWTNTIPGMSPDLGSGKAPTVGGYGAGLVYTPTAGEALPL